MSMIEQPRPKMAHYYVIPVTMLSPGGTQGVEYFQANGGSAWERVPSNKLDSGSQSCRGDLVKLTQPSEYEIEKHAPDMLMRLDRSVTLFAGVAKTLSGDEMLPAFYSATMIDNRPVMVISVMKRTVRGVILIFTRMDDAKGTLAVPIMDLVASSDPEIKNSTDGTGGD
jgi:hypothetical protein